jgi:hypothetical protein
MKYSEFLQVREILEDNGRTVADIIQNPDLLLEKAVDAATIVKAFNDKKIILDTGKQQVGILGPNNEIINRVKIDTFQKTLADNKDALTQPVREAPIATADIAQLKIGSKIDTTKLATTKANVLPDTTATTDTTAAGGGKDVTAGKDAAGGKDVTTTGGEDAAGGTDVAGGAGADAADATSEAGSTAAKAALTKGIFGIISAKALLFGVAGVGAAAIVAWVMRRQIIKAVWIKKLKNNAAKIGKQIDDLLLKNVTPMLDEKDKMIQKEKAIDAKMKETKDANTKKRLESLKAQLDKMEGDWETKFVDMINQTIDTVVDGKTKELTERIDGLKQLQPGQKTSLKTIWSTMMINFKAEGWKNLTKLKLISNDEVLAKISGDIKTELAENKKTIAAAKKELEQKYKTIKKITVGTKNTPVKYGEWYLYEKAEPEDTTTLKGNKYVRFMLDGEALGNGEEKIMAEVKEIEYEEKTGKMSKKGVGEFSTPEELDKVVANAEIKADTKTVDLDNIKKNMTKTPEQEAEVNKIAEKAKASKDRKKIQDALTKIEAVEKVKGINDPTVQKARKELNLKVLKPLGITLGSIAAATLLKALL